MQFKDIVFSIPGLRWLYHFLRNFPSLTPELFAAAPRFRHDCLMIGLNFDAAPLNGNEKRQALISRIVTAAEIDVIIETGTFVGATTAYLSAITAKDVMIETIETSVDFHRFAKWRFRNIDRVRPNHGSSHEILPTLATKYANKRCLIYLDAHWGCFLPLRDELRILRQWQNTIVMIDDFKVEDDPSFKWDDYRKVGRLELSYIADLVTNFDLFFPSYSATQDTGSNSGYMIFATSSEMTAHLASDESLRQHVKCV